MTAFQVPNILPLDPRHDRSAFFCGEKALDDYLRNHASQDARRNVASVFVAAGEPSETIIGYYTLSAASFNRDELPAALARKLPHYPIPAALIGRLAVDRRFQGRNFGKFLLINTFARIMRANEALAIHAVVVEAKNEKAAAFYQAYGFEPFSEHSRHLFLPLARIAPRS
jgi:ribosomal protein S18 acetylase RimI-like enzyme